VTLFLFCDEETYGMETQILPSGTMRELLEEKHAESTSQPATWQHLVALKSKLERKYRSGFSAETFRHEIRQTLKRRRAA
jgi:hypothetical protein